jgi:hypothetical protein
LCAKDLLTSLIIDDDNINQFFSTELNSNYHDIHSFCAKFAKSKNPIFISLNIQSLPSKYSELKFFMDDLISKNVEIDLIILQETCAINFPDLLELPGFQRVIYRNRPDMRGGGWLLC